MSPSTAGGAQEPAGIAPGVAGMVQTRAGIIPARQKTSKIPVFSKKHLAGGLWQQMPLSVTEWRTKVAHGATVG